MMMNSAITATMTSSDRAGRPEDPGHGQDAFDEVLDVDDVADARVGAQGVADDADPRRIDQLDLEAGVQRVGVEVAGQVLASLRLHRPRKFASASSRLT